MPYPERSINWAPREVDRPVVEHQYRLHRWSHDRFARFWYCSSGCGANIFDFEVMITVSRKGLKQRDDGGESMDMIYFMLGECRDNGECP